MVPKVISGADDVIVYINFLLSLWSVITESFVKFCFKSLLLVQFSLVLDH